MSYAPDPQFLYDPWLDVAPRTGGGFTETGLDERPGLLPGLSCTFAPTVLSSDKRGGHSTGADELVAMVGARPDLSRQLWLLARCDPDARQELTRRARRRAPPARS